MANLSLFCALIGQLLRILFAGWSAENKDKKHFPFSKNMETSLKQH